MLIDLTKYSNYELAQLFLIMESPKFQNNKFVIDLLKFCRPILYERIEFCYLFNEYAKSLKKE
ncbi:hypothetical protein D9V86_02015 [Bacteroidetes/Chlorobi group bacterium ChocPot_Mid]|nr:MAG: hypothetical protein D9V86_02015 [Bacteroidetes/Chlorobi group bacterium ChocPot_Mid]